LGLFPRFTVENARKLFAERHCFLVQRSGRRVVKTLSLELP
jgi:hypothetical protein